MSKHIPKEELEQDVLVTYYARVIAFLAGHRKVTIGIGVAIVLAIGLGIGYYYYVQSEQHKAETLMADAEQYFRQADYQKALNGDQQALTVGFAQIINKYTDTKAGNLAHYYAAVCELNLGNNQKALQYIQDYDPPEGILGVGPIALKAVILENLGNYKQAGQQYLKAANWDENDSTTPSNLLSAAQAFIKAGDTQQAHKAIQTIIQKYPNTGYVSQARKLNGYLTAAALQN